MIYFTSDIHLGHYLPALNRPLIGPEMDDLLINNYNAVVEPKDEVWILGDFSLASSVDVMVGWFNRMNGSKHLVQGNHDRNNKVQKMKWASIHDTHMFKDHKAHIWLSHYAHRVWPSKHHGVYHLYGHSHGHLPGYDRSMDVGVDVPENKYAPVSLDEVLRRLSPIEFKGKYHH
jgi:calcineurin-like phosphoesterase family protein